ncbi:hypothetical protein [Larkinella terrae]|uniref:Uncharacterized protein n=1 Tax=Larkinella terrae TaxID=2025311 RepID=A0A7K0EJ90_9BACT|nr:hypothetical protein [Larkinella terrae]MRS61825.1 hypothetical protein [Larkinella terrae]
MKIKLVGEGSSTPVVNAKGFVETEIQFDESEEEQTYRIEGKKGSISLVTTSTPEGEVHTLLINNKSRFSGTAYELEQFFDAVTDIARSSQVLIDVTKP